MADDKTTRHVRTGTEKAQDALEKADRKVENLEKRHARLEAEFARVTEELREARAEQSFAASHPLLQDGTEGTLPGLPGSGSADGAEVS